MHKGHGFSRAALVLADEGFKPRLQPLLWRILHEMLVRGAKHAEEKASLNEGHGFSRAVKGLRTTASAAEVRFVLPVRANSSVSCSLEAVQHTKEALIDAADCALRPKVCFIRLFPAKSQKGHVSVPFQP
jgi:hypothetical protein